MERVDVSVVICVYNSDLKRLLCTLYSVIIQKNVSFEVIIADDGSENNHKNDIIKYLNDHDFSNYIFLESEENRGTVKNILNSLKYCNGKYLKLISPGDYLYNHFTLCKWVEFMDDGGYIFSFSRYLKYNAFLPDDQIPESIQYGERPYNLDIYLNVFDHKRITYNYLLLDDFYLGAAIMVKIGLFHEYLTFLDDKVKYAEDAVFKLMIIDGIFPGFFDAFTIWYSYGDGVSTVKNHKWYKIILKDHYYAGLVVKNRLKKQNLFNLRYAIFLKSCKYQLVKIFIKYLLFPSLFIYRIEKEFSHRGNIPEYDTCWLKEILDAK